MLLQLICGFASSVELIITCNLPVFYVKILQKKTKHYLSEIRIINISIPL